MKQPVWHVLVLSILSFKLYFFYWCYKTWRDLCKQQQSSAAQETEIAKKNDFVSKIMPAHMSSFKDASPHIRALVTMIPYVNNYMLFTLSLGVCKLFPDKKSFVATHPGLTSLLIVGTSFTLSYLALMPKALYFFFFLSVIPVAVVQQLVNKYWDSVEKPGLLVRHAFTLKELAIIILGALALAYVVLSMVLVPESQLLR